MNKVATHDEYPEIIRSVAIQENVPLVDLEAITSNWLQGLGVEESKKVFHKLPAGVSRIYPRGINDDTHFNELGASTVAKLFLEDAEKQEIEELTNLIKW